LSWAPGDRLVDAEIARRKLDVATLDHAESYPLSVTPAGVLIVARTAEAPSTESRRCASSSRRTAQFRVTIGDWWVSATALSHSISVGPVPTEEQFQATNGEGLQ
jgi:hypothetical protein